MGVTTTTLGWWPKPVELKRARWQYAEGEIEASDLARVEEQATRDAIRLQQELGIDLPTDGQMNRGDLVADYAELLDGLEPAGLVRCWGNRYYRRPRISDAVSRPEPFGVAAWTKAAELAGGPLKAVLTGPYTLMDWSFDEHYGSREACCQALADALAAEAADLRDAGVTDLQLDEPAIGSRPEELGLVRQVLERVVADLGPGVRTWLRAGHGGLGPLTREVLSLPVDGWLLHHESADVGSSWPEGKRIGIGVVDVVSPEIETAETIRERIEPWRAMLPPESLVLCPDGGLRTLSREQAEGKLRALVEVARTL